MLYGREPVIPWEVNNDLGPLQVEQPELSIEEFAARMEHIREQVLDVAGDNIRKAQASQAKYYNAKHAKNEFLPGEKVYRKNPLCATKLKKLKRGYNWLGPYTVVRRNTAGNYILMDKNGKENKKAYPPGHLKRHLQREEDVLANSDDEPVDIPGHTEPVPAADPVDIPGHTEPVPAADPVDIPGHTKPEPMDTETMEAAEILAELAAGGSYLPTPLSPLSPTKDILVSLAEESLTISPTTTPPGSIVPIISSDNEGFENEHLQEFDMNLLIDGVTPAEPLIFSPLTAYVRKSVAMRLCMAVGRASKLKCDKLDYKGVGNVCRDDYNVQVVSGFGSCYFKAICYQLMGTEVKHDIIRTQVCEYISDPDNWTKLQTYIEGYPDGESYVRGSEMRLSTTWASEVEIFATAQLTGKDVHVFNRGAWQRHHASGSSKKPSKHAFYLSNPDNDHFNPVIFMK